MTGFSLSRITFGSRGNNKNDCLHKRKDVKNVADPLNVVCYFGSIGNTRRQQNTDIRINLKSETKNKQGNFFIKRFIRIACWDLLNFFFLKGQRPLILRDLCQFMHPGMGTGTQKRELRNGNYVCWGLPGRPEENFAVQFLQKKLHKIFRKEFWLQKFFYKNFWV